MSTKQNMKAIGSTSYLPINNPNYLMDLQIEKPTPTGHDLLVKVEAISVNPADIGIRETHNFNKVSPLFLGWDVSGIVEQTGPDCQLFKPGDEVYYAGSITRPGANSEFHLVDERIVGNKPKTLDFAEAAALPLTSITAWEGLFDRLGVSHIPSENIGKSILVIGAAGGVGSITIQLAKLVGLTVIGTASRSESIEWIKDHGVDFTINHNLTFAPQLQQLGFENVDYIFNLNKTTQHLKNMAEVILPQGKICCIVATKKEPIDMDMFLSKSVTFVWELMFTRSMFQTEDMIEQHKLLNKIANLIDNEKVRTTLTERISPINAQNLRNAHEKIKSGKTIGKIVLENFL